MKKIICALLMALFACVSFHANAQELVGGWQDDACPDSLEEIAREFIELESDGEMGLISVRFYPWGAYHFFSTPSNNYINRFSSNHGQYNLLYSML